MSDLFRFKQFSIIQNTAGQKLSSDAVLLGAWVNDTAETILDIGTGCGILALIMAQKTNAHIDAIDIDADAVEAATTNIQHSPWHHRINVIHADLHDFSRSAKNKYDLIICNPPYFMDGVKPVDQSVLKAKHAVTLRPVDLFRLAFQLTTTAASLHLIVPSELYVYYKEQALYSGFYLSHSLFIKPSLAKPHNRVLLRFIKSRGPELSETLLLKDEQGEMTETYKVLVAPYYL